MNVYLSKWIFGLLFSFLFLFVSFTAAQENTKVLPPVNYVRSRNIDVKHISMDLRFDWDKEQILGSEVITLAPFKDLNKINLDAAEMEIGSITLANGTALKFNYAGGSANDNLEIILDRTYKTGEDISIKIAYSTNHVNKIDDKDTAIGSFGSGVRFIKPTADNPNKPRQIWSQGETEFNRFWFPSYDSPNDFRTTELRATVQKPYFVVSNGKLMELKDNGDNTRTFYWKMDISHSNYLTSIVVGDYAEIKNGEYDGIPVYAYGYPSEAKETALTTKNLPAVIKFFSEKTGIKYPYPKYSQAFVEDFGGGMENISATTQIKEMIRDERELLDNDSESLQAHELAHQWFGDYVTCRNWGESWLNESFAVYFQTLWDEEFKGHETFLFDDIRANQQTVIGVWNQGVRRPIATKYYANRDALFDTYDYPAGGSVLHMLRKHLGDELFFKAINHYLTKNAHQPVETEQLRIAFEETTGQSLDWFFDEWIYKMGHPIFEITKSYDAAAKKLTLNVKQTQKIDPNYAYPQTEFFQTFVEMEIDGNIQRVWIKPQAENVFTFDSPTAPKIVNFDYEGTLLKEMTFDKPTDELIYQAQNDKDPIARRWAIDELPAKVTAAIADKEKILAALRTIAETDKLYQNRRAAINQMRVILAPVQSSQAAEIPAAPIDAATAATLQKAVKDQKSLVRADAIALLGTTRDAKFVDLYLAALNDPSYTVINNAAFALAVTKSPQAYDALLKLANTESWHGRIRNAGLSGLAALGDKRAFETGYKFATDKNQVTAVRTQALKVVGETGKGDQRAYPVAFEKLKTSLDNDDFPGINNAVQAIIKIGDPRGQEAFDFLKTKFKNNPQGLAFVSRFESQFKSTIGK